MARKGEDRELAKYRDLLETPTEFKDGFGWSTVVGIFFCGLVMMPGAIYLGLMTGGNMASAATWVTVILFNEVARRAMKTMSKQNLVVLLHAASVIMAGYMLLPGGPMGHLVYRAYLVTSDAVRDSGMRNYFPHWWVPAPDSSAITERLLFHRDWLIPLGIVGFTMVMGLVSKYTLGYFFFRLTSDIERLPFPMAPIQAQGAMALAEAEPPAGTAADDAKADAGRNAFLRSRRGEKKRSERWRLFSLGTTIGLAFGFIQVGIPTITGLLFDKPFFLIPQPFVDTTPLTETILPATPTGMTVDLGIVLIGFVLPFWAVIGTFAAMLFTLVANPLLHAAGILSSWQSGMDTVNTTFANSIDFYMSFGIGAAFGVAIVSVYQTVRDVRARLRADRGAVAAGQEQDERGRLWRTPKLNRGDYPMWLALIGYAIASTLLVGMCYLLLKDTGTNRVGLLGFLLVFVFLYNPFISYVNARLLGIAGQNVDIPFVKETAFIASGAKGIDVWLAPIPLDNVGYQAQAFRVNELTGVSFWSLMKTDLVALPALFVLSLMFWAFIWHAAPVPSDAFPAAQINWDLQAKQNALLFSSTFAVEGGEASIADSQFMQAVHPRFVGAGIGVTVGLFVALSTLGLPVMFVYGLIRGFGQFPHYMLLEIVGAMLGRYYFQKRFGSQGFLRMAPTILAGYFTGVGLVGMTTIALKLISTAVSPAPF